MISKTEPLMSNEIDLKELRNVGDIVAFVENEQETDWRFGAYRVLIREIEELKCDLRDCHDLLNDCGFFFEDGRWIDPQDDSITVEE